MIPDLDIHGLEKRLLDFAYNDLETCLIQKMCLRTLYDIENTLNDETHQKEIKVFLKIWTKQWLEKWRERVTICQKKPQFSLSHIKVKKKAEKIFKNMRMGPELKKMIEHQLINIGEVCMIDLIAKNMIIEEIALRINMNKGRTCSKSDNFEPWNIFQAILPRVKSLIKRKTPLIHLRLLTDP